jgi:hypothetical protein
MQGNHFTRTFHVVGTLTANVVPVFTMPFDCSLEHVSAVASNASNAQIKIGTTSDDDAYLLISDVGDSNVPAEFARANFVGAENPHIVDGTVMLVTVDFDGAAGTAAQNLTVVLTFSEG